MMIQKGSVPFLIITYPRTSLAMRAVGVWKDTDEISRLWSCDVDFAPDMAEDKRHQLLAGWHKAVGRSLDWARPQT